MRKQIILATDTSPLYNIFMVDSTDDVFEFVLGSEIEYTTDNLKHSYCYTTGVFSEPNYSTLNNLSPENAECIFDYCKHHNLFPKPGYMVTLGCIHTDNILGIISL